jgi:hypothetical protein
MNRELESDALRRKASAAGVFAGLLFLLLTSMAVLIVIGFWPVFATLPGPESVPEAKPDGLRSFAPLF